MKKLGYILLALIIASCANNSFETEGGTTVTYLKKGEGEAWKDSTISYFHIQYSTESGSEMFKSETPAPMRIGGQWSEGRGELFQILPLLNVGDSVKFEIVASDLFENTFRAQRPDSIPAESKISFCLAKDRQLTEEEYYYEAALEQKEILQSYIDTVQLQAEIPILEKYYADNNISPQITENGVGIVITEEGSGEKPKPGQSLKVNYSGYLLTGEYFDSSVKEVAIEQGLYDERREPYGPYDMKLYLSQVIAGWHEGIAELREGTKATLYIPSPLGYGPRNRSEVITANSILVFDVELVEIVE